MKKGDKVLCISDYWIYKHPMNPVKGQVYTIKRVTSCDSLELEECGDTYNYTTKAFELLDGPPNGVYGPVREVAPTHLVQA